MALSIDCMDVPALDVRVQVQTPDERFRSNSSFVTALGCLNRYWDGCRQHEANQQNHMIDKFFSVHWKIRVESHEQPYPVHIYILIDSNSNTVFIDHQMWHASRSAEGKMEEQRFTFLLFMILLKQIFIFHDDDTPFDCFRGHPLVHLFQGSLQIYEEDRIVLVRREGSFELPDEFIDDFLQTDPLRSDANLYLPMAELQRYRVEPPNHKKRRHEDD
ncbi:hypothetical protein PROFUN_11480 [Planoprotostelium fungivorum]|uniref:Uncharacterized protein n=1 Tax=Planoprotostelium fungivorum TaxID=1890364 RepID=A0A2P6N9X6_9EUKA|nr:hypothetical protein PROFUN_11480 [Planoprotostelium fungivorum]